MLVAAGLLAACGGGGSSRPRAATRSAVSSAPASASLQRAVRAMQGASGYRFDAVVAVGPDRVSLAGEFQAPDRVHELVTPSRGASVEVVIVGTGAFARDPATGAWRPSPTAPSGADPRAAFQALLQSTDVTGAGPAYHFDLPPGAVRALLSGAGVVGPGSGSATVFGGVITRLDLALSASGRPVVLHLDYTSVGSAPPVTVPRTG